MRRVICLQTPTVFWLSGVIISIRYLNGHGFINVRQKKVQKAEPLVPKPSVFDVEMTIEMLKRHESPGIYQIPTELIKAGGGAIRSQTNKLINSVWN
jgi:hypothetical protein